MAVELGAGPDYVSFSQLTTWLKCGRAYYLGRVQKVPETPAFYLAGGSAVHASCDAVDYHRLSLGLA